MDQAGVCRRVDFGDGTARYEHHFGHDHHDHLICTRCGKFVEIFSPRLEKLQAEQKAFNKDTRKLRQNIYQKKLALKSELAKEKPDAKKALTMQKEISDLKAEMDQKRIKHLIKVREIAPNAGRGMMKGFGHRGGGKDRGYDAGDGPCWR